MTITGQILWGSFVLGICAILHLLIMIYWARSLRHINQYFSSQNNFIRLFLLIGGTFAVILLAHTIHVWVWAGFILQLDALNAMSDAIYFSLVTYTTVGYGDLTIGEGFRIFGAMAAVSGLLSFGVSTAFLVSLLGKLFSEHLD